MSNQNLTPPSGGAMKKRTTQVRLSITSDEWSPSPFPDPLNHFLWPGLLALRACSDLPVYCANSAHGEYPLRWKIICPYPTRRHFPKKAARSFCSARARRQLTYGKRKKKVWPCPLPLICRPVHHRAVPPHQRLKGGFIPAPDVTFEQVAVRQSNSRLPERGLAQVRHYSVTWFDCHASRSPKHHFLHDTSPDRAVLSHFLLRA